MLREIDGPMLLHGLEGFDGRTLTVPARPPLRRAGPSTRSVEPVRVIAGPDDTYPAELGDGALQTAHAKLRSARICTRLAAGIRGDMDGDDTAEDELDLAEDELDLAEAIDAVRRELGRAQDAGRDADVRFTVGAVEVEFVVEVVKKGGGEASVKVFGILSLGGKGEVSRGLTNRIKVVLNPIGVGGKPLEVASAQDHRPDAEGSGHESPTDGRPGG